MKTYEKIWIYILGFCLAIQVIQFFKIADINKFLVSFYGTSTESDAMRVSNYNNLNLFRSGSIFIAINPYFKIVLGVLSIVLNKRIRHHSLNSNDNFLINIGIIIALASSLFVGSRTCFIIIAICLAEYIYLYQKTTLHTDRRLIVCIVIAFIVLWAGGYLESLIKSITNIRMFTIIRDDGTTGSLEHKIRTIKSFFNNSYGLSWLFGRGVYKAETQIEQMDSDLGYLFAYYGLFGIIFLYFLIRAVFIKGKEDPSQNNAFGIMWSTIITLSVVTSGVFLNMRVFGSLITMFFVNKYSTEVDKNG